MTQKVQETHPLVFIPCTIVTLSPLHLATTQGAKVSPPPQKERHLRTKNAPLSGPFSRFCEGPNCCGNDKRSWWFFVTFKTRRCSLRIGNVPLSCVRLHGGEQRCFTTGVCEEQERRGWVGCVLSASTRIKQRVITRSVAPTDDDVVLLV